MAVAASAQLHQVAAQLRAAGNGGIVRELSRGLRTGAAPLPEVARRSALEKLPKAGGLNRQVAKQRITVSVTTGLRTAGVQLQTRAPDTAETEAGYVWHPVFGHKDRRVRQEIPAAAHWWSEPLAQHTPEITAELLRTLSHYETVIQGRR